MYDLIKDKKTGNLEDTKFSFDGIVIKSKNKTFNVNGCNIKNVLVINKVMADVLTIDLVSRKYNKLINKLMVLLTSDDDTGESFREALNLIEKFRLEIKIKYRKFLDKKILKQMALQLKQLQKEAEERILVLQNFQVEKLESSKGGKSR